MATLSVYEGENMIEKCGLHFKMITGNIKIGTYATNGVSMDLSKYMPTKVHAVIVDGNAGYVGQYDYANKKPIVYEAGEDGAALDQVGDSADLSAVNMRFLAIGK